MNDDSQYPAGKNAQSLRRRFDEHRYTVLVADDNVDNREICAEILATDYHVLTAGDGEQAIALAKQHRPAAILMDLMMPVMDGLEASRRLRADAATRDIPIVILSARAETEDVVAGLEVAEDYIVKPFEFRELLARVRSAVRLKTTQDHVRRLNQELESLVEKRTEQLLERQKLAIVGQYAAGIVHNLGGALQKVMTSLELAELNPARRDQYLATALNGSREMRDIVSTILDKGRNEQRLDYTDVDLNEVIQSALRFWEADQEFRHTIRKEIDLDPDLPTLSCVHAHWSQTLDNLIGNAIEAMAGEQDKVLHIATRRDADSIILEISDNGCGMDAAQMDRIFDPFFSTKSAGHGTGLGLASVAALMEPYGVTIAVKSAPGEGATFTLNVPLHDSATAREGSAIRRHGDFMAHNATASPGVDRDLPGARSS